MFQTTFSNRVYVNPNRKSLQFSEKSTKFSITYYERFNIGSKRKTRAQSSTPKTPRQQVLPPKQAFVIQRIIIKAGYACL